MKNASAKVKLSVVTTLYYSQPYLAEFYTRIKTAAEKLFPSFEIIFVNDGSPDDSLAQAIMIQKSDPRVRVIDLTRNFGHHPALLTGLAHAQGELIFMMDCDLEEDPAWLENFHNILVQKQCDVVYGVQIQRKGAMFERLSGAIFYRLFNFLSSIRMPENVITTRLMTRRYVQSLLEHRERAIYLEGLLQLTGYEQIAQPVEKRSKSSTTYGFILRARMLINAITSFSDRPLKYIFFTGLAISSLALLYITWLLFQWTRYGIPVMGWSSLIVSVWFLGGLTILFIGVIGIYLSRIFLETKGRPVSLVRAVYGGPSDSAS